MDRKHQGSYFFDLIFLDQIRSNTGKLVPVKAAAHIIALSARSLDYMNNNTARPAKRGRIPEGYLGKVKSKRGVFGSGMSRVSCGHSDEEI